ncbi:UNVERIFIED_CONTAM: HVA22-like protein h [Sesamum radiatum]|uniref:HVA22-like protein h n=1 Tax=Sesamum radiatum TaxID=300843 RepID=A0AAW2KT97_SESRA
MRIRPFNVSKLWRRTELKFQNSVFGVNTGYQCMGDEVGPLYILMGTGYVYDTLLRPYVSKHETDIDRSLIEFRERAWNLAVYYWHNCTELGSTKILQFLHFVTSQSARGLESTSSENVADHRSSGPPPSAPPSSSFGIFKEQRQGRPASPRSGPSMSHRSQTAKSEAIKVELDSKTQFIRPEDILVPGSDICGGSEKISN